MGLAARFPQLCRLSARGISRSVILKWLRGGHRDSSPGKTRQDIGFRSGSWRLGFGSSSYVPWRWWSKAAALPIIWAAEHRRPTSMVFMNQPWGGSGTDGFSSPFISTAAKALVGRHLAAASGRPGWTPLPPVMFCKSPGPDVIVSVRAAESWLADAL